MMKRLLSWIRRWFRRGVTGMAGMALASCTSYQRDFREAVAARSGPAVSPEGPWKGEWRSAMNGHRGPLWCLVERRDDGRHAFRYRAGWGAMSFGDYTHFPATRADGAGGLVFSGDMELPGGFGTHTVEGRLDARKFEARFRSERGDHGVMELSRPD